MWASRPDELDGADLVVLPGSKHVAGDLAWLRDRGLDRAIADRAARGERVLAICGGLQLLGGAIDDAAGVDGSGISLGLLPVRTVFRPEKRTEAASGANVFGAEKRSERSTASPPHSRGCPSRGSRFRG